MKPLITLYALGAFIWLAGYSLSYAKDNSCWLSRLYVAHMNGVRL